LLQANNFRIGSGILDPIELFWNKF